MGCLSEVGGRRWLAVRGWRGVLGLKSANSEESSHEPGWHCGSGGKGAGSIVEVSREAVLSSLQVLKVPRHSFVCWPGSFWLSAHQIGSPLCLFTGPVWHVARLVRASVARGPSGHRKFHLLGPRCCLSTERQAGRQAAEDRGIGSCMGQAGQGEEDRRGDGGSPGRGELGEDKGMTAHLEGDFLQQKGEWEQVNGGH